MRAYVAVLMAGLVVRSFAMDSLDQWSAKIWSRTLPAAKDSAFIILKQDGSGSFTKATARSLYKYNTDGSFTEEYSGPEETSHSEFLKNGRLASSRTDNSKAKKTYNVAVSPDRGRASFRTEAMGEKPSVKDFAMKPSTIVMTEYVNLIRSAWQSGLRGAFSFKGLPPDGSMEIEMETRLVETNAPWELNDKYEFPSEFKAAFLDSRKYVVADFSLGGLFSVMYRFHNYWIFRVAPSGLEYVGSFGGDPKKAAFAYIIEK